MILVDSSVWIDFITGTSGSHNTALQALISDMHDICLTDINVMEVLRGIKNDLVYRKIRDDLMSFNILSAAGISTYHDAAELYRSARRTGITVNSTFDCLIAQIAIENNVSILSKDKDFQRLAEVQPKLKVVEPEMILALSMEDARDD